MSESPKDEKSHVPERPDSWDEADRQRLCADSRGQCGTRQVRYGYLRLLREGRRPSAL